MHEDALALGDLGLLDEAERRRPVEHDGRRGLGRHAVRHADQVLLRQVDQLGLGVVHGQAGDQVAGLDVGAVRLRPPGEAVAGGERRFPLHVVLAPAHVDVGAGEAREDRGDLHLARLGRFDARCLNVDFGDIAELGNDNLANRSSHVG